MIIRRFQKYQSILIFLGILCFTNTISCSLNYETNSKFDSQSPEFVFTNPTYVRIDEGKQNLRINADIIEQYTFEDTLYAKNIDFSIFNKSEEKTAEGKGKLLSANLTTGLYYLFDDITVKSYDRNLIIQCSSLKWNNKSEQLTTNIENIKDSKVSIVSEDETKISMDGYGFSASGFDNSFIFTGEVSGEITTKD
jgi:hypothetical protein